MKVFTAIFLLFSLQLAVPVFSDSLEDLMREFTRTVQDVFSYSNKGISQQYLISTIRLSQIHEQKILPAISKAYQDMEDYFEQLQSRTSNSRPISMCIGLTQQALAKQPNVTEKATQHLDVYNNILNYLNIVGRYNNNVTYRELDSINTLYTGCISSAQPQVCNDTVAEVLTSKKVRIQDLFIKNMQRFNLAYIREIGNFESRTADYVKEVISTAKPFLSLAEGCVAAVYAGFEF